MNIVSNLQALLEFPFEDKKYRLALTTDKKSGIVTLIQIGKEEKKSYKEYNPDCKITTSLRKIALFLEQNQAVWESECDGDRINLEKKFSYFKQCINKHNSRHLSWKISFKNPYEWSLVISLKIDEQEQGKASFDTQKIRMVYDRLTSYRDITQLGRTLLNKPVLCHFTCKDSKCGYASHSLTAKINDIFANYSYGPEELFDNSKEVQNTYFLTAEKGRDLELEINVFTPRDHDISKVIENRHEELKSTRDWHYRHGARDQEDFSKKKRFSQRFLSKE